MKRIFCTVTAAIIFFSFAGAQRTDAVIKGKVVDTALGKPLANASISVLYPKDSSLVTFSLTNTQGIFLIKGLNPGTYRVIISHEGYNEIQKQVTLTAKQELDLGAINPVRDFQTLGEVVISSNTPVVIKDDTIQFNASAFKTKPNATVEDLLKKLPGVEVDRDGAVKTQGEQVQKIYVNGKEFFGTDPQMATKNLTADMVESVQVFEDMSDQAKFTKIDDGNRIKTINIRLKKNRSKGYFGRAMAAYGDQQKYKANLSLNKFSETQRISVIFNSNNVNDQGFSLYDGPSSGGGRGSLRSGGGFGINKTWATGFNYVDQWGEKMKLSGSYLLSNSNSRQDQSTLRQSIFTDSTAVLNKTNSSLNKSQNHRFNMRFEYQLDSLTSILYTPSLSIQHADYRTMDTSFTYSEIPSARYLSVTGKTDNKSNPGGVSLNNNLLFRHRFIKTGRTLTIGWNNTNGHNNNQGYTLSDNEFYSEDGIPYRSIYQNQQNNQKNTTHNNIISTSYTEPFGRNKLLELNYAYTHNISSADKHTYDYNPSTDNFDNPNLPLTNTFDNSFIAHRFGFNFRGQQAKYNYQLGVGMQRSMQESDNYQAVLGKDSIIRQRYTNFFPTANFALTPARGKSLQFRYSGRTNPPATYQLQNVLDVTDPLHVRTGNPNLKQEFNHNFTIGYNTFNQQTFRFLAGNLNFSTTTNKIVNSIDTLSSNIELTRPENVNGFYQLSSFITVGVSARNTRMKGSNLSFTNNISYSRNISLLYRKKNIGQTLNVVQGVVANMNREKFDASIRMNLTYTDVRYSVNSSLNEKYFSQTYAGDFSYSFPADIILFLNFDYYVNTGRAAGYNQSIPLLNAALAKQVFKNKRGEIRFTINDILNQNQSISRSTGDNFIQDTRSTVLRRYFLVSFLFNLNKMGGKRR